MSVRPSHWRFVTAVLSSAAIAFGLVAAAPAQTAATTDARTSTGTEPAAESARSIEEEPPSEAFYDSVDVNVVNIDVYVEDDDGDPVRGLTKEDFELYVDGVEVPIAGFYSAEGDAGRLRAGSRVARGVRPPPDERADGTPASPTDEASGEHGLSVVFYIDNFNLRPPDRNRVLRRLGAFVMQRVPLGAQMMLVTYDHSLHVRQPFTRDPRLILDAAEATEELAAHAVSRDADRRIAVDAIDDADDAMDALSEARSFAEAREAELDAPLEALTELMEPLGGLPGRVALVYVSSGLPLRVGEDLFTMAAKRFPRSHAQLTAFRYDMSSTYDRLVRAGNSAGVTIYALDAGGLQSFESLSAAEGGSVRGGSYLEVDAVRRGNLQAPLHEMAVETGGRALTNSNNVDLLLDQLAQDLTAYYSLGYDAGSSRDGQYHEIEVKVDRPGVEVRHRDAFRALSVERRLEQGIQAALRLGPEKGDPFGLRAVTDRTSGGGDGIDGKASDRVQLDVQIPLAEIALVPTGRQWRGRLRVVVGAIDTAGNLSPLTRSEPLDLTIPNEEYERALQQHVTWSAELVVDVGHQRVAIGVADLVSGQLGYTETRVERSG